MLGHPQLDSLPVTLADIRAAADRIKGAVKRTPSDFSYMLSEAAGCDLVLKFENLQFTASFKERGARNKLLSLSPEDRRKGVIAVSAGNHAQAVARHCSELDIPATIVMPRHTPFSKVARTEAFGVNVVLAGDSFTEAQAAAADIRKREGLTLVHPFDDPAIIAGQGTTAVELLEDHPDLDMLVVPIGGGGLISGCAIAAKSIKPDIEVIGTQTTCFPGMKMALEGRSEIPIRQTIADGVAVKAPSAMTLAVAAALVDDILLLEEDQIENAVCMLVEAEKIVAEGAGALSLAAVIENKDRFRDKKVGLIVSGGNIDSRVLAGCLMRGMVRDGRMARLSVQMEDVPGSLAKIAAVIADEGGNIIEVLHQRLGIDLSLRYTGIEVTVETKDRAHTRRIIAALEAKGFAVELKE